MSAQLSQIYVFAVCKMLFDLGGGTKDYLLLVAGPQGVEYTVGGHHIVFSIIARIAINNLFEKRK